MKSGGFKRRKIVLITSSLSGGGAERIVVTMSEFWAAEGHDVSVITLRSDPLKEYPLSARVRKIPLNLIQEKNSFLNFGHVRRLWHIRQTVRLLCPDVVISYLDKLNVAVLIALIGLGIPVVATEHLAPWMTSLGAGWETLRRLVYRRAVAVVSPTQAITRWFERKMPGRFITLPSPPRFVGQEKKFGREKRILAVGRLASQKGFDVLLEAFARIAPRFPDWRLEVAGEGPERERLTALSTQLRVKGQFRLLGQREDVDDLYRGSEVFVLSSRHEAFPMALCEAMSAGCCVVATRCPTGPQEILGEVSFPMLVPPEDAVALAAALAACLEDPAVREINRNHASQRAEVLSVSRVMALWSDALDQWCKDST